MYHFSASEHTDLSASTPMQTAQLFHWQSLKVVTPSQTEILPALLHYLLACNLTALPCEVQALHAE